MEYRDRKSGIRLEYRDVTSGTRLKYCDREWVHGENTVIENLVHGENYHDGGAGLEML